jgi:hypothetical protein
MVTAECQISLFIGEPNLSEHQKTKKLSLKLIGEKKRIAARTHGG